MKQHFKLNNIPFEESNEQSRIAGVGGKCWTLGTARITINLGGSAVQLSASIIPGSLPFLLPKKLMEELQADILLTKQHSLEHFSNRVQDKTYNW
jgi:hypothetical protein